MSSQKGLLNSESSVLPLPKPLAKDPRSQDPQTQEGGSKTDKPCICGCNVPDQFKRRFPRAPFSDPKTNFQTAVASFSDYKRVQQPPMGLQFGQWKLNLYDLFHCLIAVKQHCQRIRWRIVCRILRIDPYNPNLITQLKHVHIGFLKEFEEWLRSNDPSSVTMSGANLKLNVVKDYIPDSRQHRFMIKFPNFAEFQKSEETDISQSEAGPPENEYGEAVSKKKVIEEKGEQQEIRVVLPKGKVKKKRRRELILPSIREGQKYEGTKLPSFEKMFCGKQEVEELPKLIPKKRNAAKIEPTPIEPSEKPIETTPTTPTSPEKTKPNPSSELQLKTPSKRGRPSAAKIQEELNSISIPNPMTSEFRHSDPKELGYRIDFKSGYTPIEIQAESIRQEEELTNKKLSKQHFIRQKQSAANIQRCCGVTYVLPSESKQIGADPSHKPLPPLAFQVGTLKRCKLSPEEEASVLQVAEKKIEEMLRYPALSLSVISKCSEGRCKDYLLGQELNEQKFILSRLKEIWRFFTSDTFCAVHFDPSNKFFLKPTHPNNKGQIILGIHTQKGACSTRAIKNSLNIAFSPSELSKRQAIRIKLELYITKGLWTKASKHTKSLLCAFIQVFEGKLQSWIQDWTQERIQIYKANARIPRLGVYQHTPCSHPPQPRKFSKKIWETLNFRDYRGGNYLICKHCGSYNGIEDYFAGEGYNEIIGTEPLFLYMINTRDSFSYDLIVKESTMVYNEREILKKEFFFHSEDLPPSYKNWEAHQEGELVRVGITTYENFFTQEELEELEKLAFEVESDFLSGQFLPNTAQPTKVGNTIKRTKFFFGIRYMWTACQLAEPQSCIAAGVRSDVSPPPPWMKSKVERRLAEAKIIPENFINSIAMNIYHTGTEGLAQHFDDAVRFKQPVFTIKLCSDSRLSFGSQFYGFCNGAFTIPCPRGVICEMEDMSFAANNIKHCVRPTDMQGRSITMIMRQIHPFIMVRFMQNEAHRYETEIDLPTWFSTLSLEDNAMTYAMQKEVEAKKLKTVDTETIRNEVRNLMNDMIVQLEKGED